VEMPEAKEELPADTLRKYCAEHTAALEPADCLRAIERAHHGCALRSVCRLLIKDWQSTKKHVLWLAGRASTGKSFFIRRLSPILGTKEVAWRGDYLPEQSTSRPELKTQLVTCEEFDFHTAFGPSTIETTKLLFEGRSGFTRVGPYQQFETRFCNASFLVASNTLPADDV